MDSWNCIGQMAVWNVNNITYQSSGSYPLLCQCYQFNAVIVVMITPSYVGPCGEGGFQTFLQNTYEMVRICWEPCYKKLNGPLTAYHIFAGISWLLWAWQHVCLITIYFCGYWTFMIQDDNMYMHNDHDYVL